METKKEIILCYGSSCFARGNKWLVPQVKEFLGKNGLLDHVEFRGQHCFGKCIEGPSMRIDNVFYNKLNSQLVTEILTRELLP